MGIVQMMESLGGSEHTSEPGTTSYQILETSKGYHENQQRILEFFFLASGNASWGLAMHLWVHIARGCLKR
jgi:hypothetical protein